MVTAATPAIEVLAVEAPFTIAPALLHGAPKAALAIEAPLKIVAVFPFRVASAAIAIEAPLKLPPPLALEEAVPFKVSWKSPLRD